MTFAVEISVRFTNEQTGKVVARYEREMGDLRRELADMRRLLLGEVDQVRERVDELELKPASLRVVNGK